MRIQQALLMGGLLLTSPLSHADDGGEITDFPLGELFTPIMADAREPQFSFGFREARTNGPIKRFTAAIVSYGEHFGLRRWQTNANEFWQISLAGAVNAQFNLDSKSNDLINADYAVGVSGTHRRDRVSWRYRIFHQSTHLGDEFLLSEPNVERVNFSLEGTDLMLSYEWPEWRLLGGAMYLVHAEPSQLEDSIGYQLDAEYHSVERVFLNGRLVAGIDCRFADLRFERPDINFKTGVEYGKRGSGNRRIRVMLTAYDGSVPFGQFFTYKTRAVGISVYLGF